MLPADLRAQDRPAGTPTGQQDTSDPHAEHADPPPGRPADQQGATPADGPEIPPITDADRAAAFPDVHGHTVHDTVLNYFVLIDRLEWQSGAGRSGMWDAKAWIGGDVNRFWFRSDGAAPDGDLDDAEVHLLYGRAVARWWDLVAGVRQDFEPGPAETWVAFGLQGLAPFWLEVEATGYLGADWRTAVRLEAEVDVLLTNRLILQPLVEVDALGKADPARGLGSGLSSVHAGLRLRYEVRREMAPYIGIAWTRKLYGTADLAELGGQDIGRARFVVGLRAWF
jgi:copper resistance protein B